jgi:thioredoxin-related protein
MRYTRLLVVSLTAAVSLINLSVLAGDAGTGESPVEKQAKEITWLSFDEGLTKLNKEPNDKHMFIDITASWCGWCKRMEKEAFSDPQVIATVNEFFVPVKLWSDSREMLDIDGYKISEQNLARTEFNVRGVPVFWFISPDKVKIGPLRGYQTTERMAKALEWVKNYEYDTTGAKQDSTEAEKNK